jgi:2-keto-4-pentenoate hydratase/2-oxohepta-3-ene-1,7-dioic acid hydratase in catechol pathway
MRLVTYEAGGAPRVGVLDEQGDVHDAGFEGDMVSFIAAGAPVACDGEAVRGARLLAPLRPRTMRDFMSFEGHFRAALSRLGRPIPDEWQDTPAYYKALPDTVVGPDVTVPFPHYASDLDHELELAAIIGREIRDATPEEAEDAIFGYTLWNDLSARDVQRRELPIGMGPGKAKDWDASNVLGPCIVTADEVDLGSMRLTVRVNGETWGGDAVAAMHFSFGELIAYASQDLTLRPGELFGSGTATGGSGVELGRGLSPGDVVELEATGLGILRTTIGQRDKEQ